MKKHTYFLSLCFFLCFSKIQAVITLHKVVNKYNTSLSITKPGPEKEIIIICGNSEGVVNIPIPTSLNSIDQIYFLLQRSYGTIKNELALPDPEGKNDSIDMIFDNGLDIIDCKCVSE